MSKKIPQEHLNAYAKYLTILARIQKRCEQEGYKRQSTKSDLPLPSSHRNTLRHETNNLR
jgi:hypothetical protein